MEGFAVRLDVVVHVKQRFNHRPNGVAFFRLIKSRLDVRSRSLLSVGFLFFASSSLAWWIRVHEGIRLVG